MHRGRAALCGRGIWCFNVGLTRSDRHGQGSGPAGEVAMLIKHPRADMAANAAKPASEAAMERAEAEAGELNGLPALARRRYLLVGIGGGLPIIRAPSCGLYEDGEAIGRERGGKER